MPRFISQVNSAGAIGISSDGTDQGNVTKINFENNRIEVKSGIATVMADPLSVVGL